MRKYILLFQLLCGLLLPSIGFSQFKRVSIGTSETLASVTSVTPDTIIISGIDGLFKSFDHGKTWSKTEVDIPGTYFYDLHFFNSKVGLGVGPIVTSNSQVIAKTNNGGNNWSMAFISNSGNYPRETTDLEFITPLKGFAVGSNGRAFKTTDAGNNWAQFYSDGSTYFKAIRFVSESVGYILSSRYLQKTNGTTILQTTLYNSNNDFIDFQALNEAHLYALTASTLKYTTNGATTWNTINLPFDDVTKMAVLNTSTIYVATENGLYITRNTGSTWEYFKETKGISIENIHLTQSGFGVLVGHNGACMITDNFGGVSVPILKFSISQTQNCGNTVISFKNQSSPSNSYTWLHNDKVIANSYDAAITTEINLSGEIKLVGDNGSGRDTLKQSFSAEVYNVIADAGPDIYACYGESVKLSAKGGWYYNWSPATGLSNTTIANPISTYATTTEYVVSVQGAGNCIDRDTVRVFRASPIQELPWTATTLDFTDNTTGASDVKMVNDTLGYTIAGKLLLKTIDGGKRWTKERSFIMDDNQWTADIEIINKDTFFVSSLHAFKTYDGGKNFIAFDNVYAYDTEVIDGVVYSIGTGAPSQPGSYIRKSVDRGKSWTNCTLPPELITMLKLDCADATHCIASGHGGIYVTQDGQNWTRANYNGDVLVDIQFVDSQVAYGVYPQQSGLWKSTDGGLNWFKVGQKYLKRITFIDSNIGYATGNNVGELYQTINGGECWQLMGNLGKDLNRVLVKDSYALLTTGLWTSPAILRADIRPRLEFDIDTSIKCTGKPFSIINKSFGYEIYKWFVDNVELSYQAAIQVILETPGVHSIKLSGTRLGQDSHFSKEITVGFTPSKPIIDEGLYHLKSEFSGENHWYLNNTLLTETSSRIIPTNAGTYKVKAISNGCESPFSESLLYTIKSISFGLVSSEICAGSTLEATNSSYGFESYNWLIDGVLISDTYGLQKTMSEPGTRNVSLIGKYKTLSDTIHQEARVNPNPTKAAVFLGDNRRIFQGESISFQTATFFPYYSWSNGSHESTLEISSDTLTIGEHQYWVTVKDDFACTQSDSILLTVDEITGLPEANGYGLSIYPNPLPQNSNYVRIVSPTYIDKTSFIIKNTANQTVPITRKESVSDTETNLYFDASPPGLYLILYRTEKAVTYFKMIIR